MAGEPSVLLGDLESLVQDPKCTADFSADTKGLLAQADSLAADGKLGEAIEMLSVMEKKARNAHDSSSVALISLWILEAIAPTGNWDLFNESLIALSRKRGQLKRVIVDMVNCAMKHMEDPGLSKDTVYKLIEAVCSVTEGKIFVEVERARVIMKLALMKEAEGKLAEASALLQEVQVETSIAMEKHEKTNYILEQMRLVLAREDYVRSQIVSKKINRKILEASDFQMTKLRYFSYMIQLHLHFEEYREICECLMACLDTPIVRSCTEGEMEDIEAIRPFLPENLSYRDLAQWFLEGVVLFSLLAQQTPEQVDLARRIYDKEKKPLAQSPAFRSMLEDFLTQDIVRYPPAYAHTILAHPYMQSSPYRNPEVRHKLFKERIIQHNITVMAAYYKRCSLTRMAELFDIDLSETEEQLCSLVSSGLIKAKIDRPAGIVAFGDGANRDRMAEWSKSISRTLDLLEEAGHLLEKEKLLHATLCKRKKAC